MKERSFTTMTGRQVALRIFVQEQNISKVGAWRGTCCATATKGHL
jgi:hypothetical protein